MVLESNAYGVRGMSMASRITVMVSVIVLESNNNMVLESNDSGVGE
jgi:hypothetical protein